MKKLVMILVIAAMTTACGDLAQAELDIPASGTFDIIIDPPETPGLNFEPEPWVSPSLLANVLLWPFATDDLYTGAGSDYNLALAQFQNGNINITDSDSGAIEGDLGIRIHNNTGDPRTFEPSVLTLDFVDDSLDVFLPEFTFGGGTDLFFWVAQSGATYYADSSKGVGFPDFSAGHVMDLDDEYLARTPEPATVVLFGLGALVLRRRCKAGSN
ncbi:MAG: PEP-CTERM sorting domain-containing protein [Planctomycetota bacterium]|jgi:hypothetical protein